MEVSHAHQMVPVVEPTQPSAARYMVREIADSVGFDEADSYRAGLVATELATNLSKHARGGEILARVLDAGADSAVELIAVDRGPGIRDVAAALADGHSTAGSPGTGLGAIRRLADMFDMHTTEGRGTVIVARLGRKRRLVPRAGGLEFAGVSLPKSGETVCGDAWSVRFDSEGAYAAVVDGLGHGMFAAEAAHAALGAFERQYTRGGPRTLEEMHLAARHTRGAAGAIAEIRPLARLVKFAGVGNIAIGIVADAGLRHAVSHAGTLGHEARVFREYSYPWDSSATLVMHSDGLASHWSFDGLAGLARRHPAVVAAVLYREFSRNRDDVTVLVGRERQ